MNNLKLFKELMRFIFSRENFKIIFLYLIITIIFYPKLKNKFVGKAREHELTTGEVADDIYPLF